MIIGTVITGLTGLAFPMFASYRALLSNDISLIRPWLMYWTVFATFQFAEDMFRPILNLVPLYGLAKSSFLIWMVLPQTQGSVMLYQTRLEPWLRHHNEQIESFFGSVLALVNATPIPLILRLFGIDMPKGPKSGGTGSELNSAPGSSGQQSNQPSYLDSFMESFRLNGNPEANLSAYLPSILGGNISPSVLNRLKGVVKSLDTEAEASTSTYRASEREAFDFVEVPGKTPPPGPGNTEIEREIMQKLH